MITISGTALSTLLPTIYTLNEETVTGFSLQASELELDIELITDLFFYMNNKLLHYIVTSSYGLHYSY